MLSRSTASDVPIPLPAKQAKFNLRSPLLFIVESFVIYDFISGYNQIDSNGVEWLLYV